MSLPISPIPFETLLTQKEVCQMLRVHRDTLHRWSVENPPRIIPVVFSGRWVRYRLTDIKALIQASAFRRKKKPGPKPRIGTRRKPTT